MEPFLTPEMFSPLIFGFMVFAGIAIIGSLVKALFRKALNY